jgi:F420-dependent oxidoreductase-like protein
MRFGAFVPQGWRLGLIDIDPLDHWPAMRGVAETIERSGFESLWVFDHFHTVPVPTQQVTYEAWTMMAALAAATDSVRLGQMCTCNSYRPPAYLAKVAACIDVISGGRLEMGIGAGWYDHEYLAYGYPFPKPSVRIGQLAEGVEIMRRMWTEEEATFEGEYFRIDGAISQPKPIQKPHIPFWIAGGGKRLTLRLAAERAAYSNFGDDPEEFRHLSEVLADHCRDVGRDFDEIVRSTNFTVFCAETEAEARERVGWLRSYLEPVLSGPDLEEAVEDWGGFAGTPEQIIETLQTWSREGMSYAIVSFPDAAYDTTSLELFAREVIPALSD